jgi:hypothetical protein
MSIFATNDYAQRAIAVPALRPSHVQAFVTACSMVLALGPNNCRELRPPFPDTPDVRKPMPEPSLSTVDITIRLPLEPIQAKFNHCLPRVILENPGGSVLQYGIYRQLNDGDQSHCQQISISAITPTGQAGNGTLRVSAPLEGVFDVHNVPAGGRCPATGHFATTISATLGVAVDRV